MTVRKAAKQGKETTPIPSRAVPGAKILIVDDDERNLLALTEVLDPLAEVVTVSSGRDALRVLLKQDFAVILLDVFMPDMDGYETAQYIREREQTARIPIIFLSAVNKETEHLMRGYAMGAVDYVFKPVDALVLRSKAAVFVDLYALRKEIEDHSRAEKELHAARIRAEEQRLEMERELQDTRLRQAAILNSLPVVLFEATYTQDQGLRRRVVGGDRAALSEDAAAWLSQEGTQWEEQILPEDRPTVASEYAKPRASGDRASVRYRWAAAGGTPLHLLEQAVCLDDDAWIGSITDITAQSQLENQLVQAQKLDALGQLTGGVAHDFNNLLAAILGGIELLGRRANLNDAHQSILNQMHQAVDQGIALVKSLLAFARKQPLTPIAVDPERLRQTTVALAEHALDSSIRVEWNIAAEGYDFYADPSQLTLALLNLIINARDAMPEGGSIAIAIDRPTGSIQPDMLRIVLSDEGTGIPPEILAKVTEPFFTTKPPGKGTGLGLSMVAGFVEQSGGVLEITAPDCGGTRVEIHLPAVVAGRSAAMEKRAPHKVANGALSVLLVDDDDMVRTVLAQIIEDLGHEASLAIDGEDALRQLRDRPSHFDVVLSDVSMPRMNGIELANALDDENFAVPIVMMSGNLDPDLQKSIPHGVSVIAKPLHAAVLEDLLCSLGGTAPAYTKLR
ncbi:MAG: response regulator [Novosphingobium sp.]|nr:response regulator [Novosphingobium sp.]